MWDRIPPSIAFYKAAPTGMAVLCLKDEISEPNALGFHTEGPDGSYWGDIAVKPVLDNDGGILDGGTSGYSVASVLSHEAVELFGDETVNIWVDGPAIAEGMGYAFELCDPVEGTLYTVTLPDSTKVLVSDFVGPKWFDIMAPAGSDLDYCMAVSHPFHLAIGGYFVVRKAPGSEQQVFGEVMPPQWRMAMKRKAGRTFLRQKGE